MTENSPISFYQENCTHFTEKLKIIKRKLLRIGMLRLVLFLLIAGLVYLLRAQTNLMILSALAGLVLFLVLVSKTTSIRSEKKRLDKLLELNKKELRILNRDLTGIDEGRDFLDDQHFYNQDIDLFGAGSIFQLINRTGTVKGREKLAEFLNANEIEGVNVRQEAIKELSEMAAWRQGFQTTAELIETQIEHKTILQWMLNYRAKIQPIFRWLPTVISIGSILVFVAYGFGLISGGLILVWFFVGLIITGLYRTNPMLSLALLLSLFSLAGIPPVAGFFGKFFLYTAAAEKGYYLLVFIAVINVTISLYYYLLPVRAMFLRKSENPIPYFKSKLFMRIGLIMAMIGIFVLGLYSPVYNFIFELSKSL